MKRNALIARIHIAKGKCMVCTRCDRLVFDKGCGGCGDNTPLAPISDKRYRTLLMAVGGTSSCATMSDSGLVKVMGLFDRAGFAKAYPFVSMEDEAAKSRKKVIWAIRARAPDVLGPDWERRVEGFVKKSFNKPSLTFCDPTELRKVFGWINRTAKYQTKKGN